MYDLDALDCLSYTCILVQHIRFSHMLPQAIWQAAGSILLLLREELGLPETVVALLTLTS